MEGLNITTVKQYNEYIKTMLAAIIIDGIFAGYCFDEEKNDLLFVPLHVGFVLVFILYYFIEKKANMLAGEEKSPRY